MSGGLDEEGYLTRNSFISRQRSVIHVTHANRVYIPYCMVSLAMTRRDAGRCHENASDFVNLRVEMMHVSDDGTYE